MRLYKKGLWLLLIISLVTGANNYSTASYAPDPSSSSNLVLALDAQPIKNETEISGYDRLNKLNLDSLSAFDSREVIRFNGFGSPLEINQFSSNQSNQKIQIINASHSVISNLILFNTTIELINSPYSEISNNIVQDVANHGSTEIISLINSSHSLVMNNTIQEIGSSNNQTVGISVLNSNNITIRGNIIKDIHTTIYERFGDLTAGILISESYNVTIQSNDINNIRGSSATGILIINSNNNQIFDNQIYQIDNIISSRTEAFGIFLFNSTDIQIYQNSIQTILSNSEILLALSFGITLLDVSRVLIRNNIIDNIQALSDSPQAVGVTISNSSKVQLQNNSITAITTISEVESKGFAIGVELSSSSFVTLDNNIISNVISLGRIAYGISGDSSEDLELQSNQIDSIKAISIYVVNAEGIILRDSNRTTLSGNIIHNVIAEITPSELPPIFPRIATAVGITIFEVLNITISTHLISEIESITTDIPADAMGIIISYAQYINIYSNLIKEIITLDLDGLSLGVLLSRSKNSEILANNLTNIISNGSVYYIMHVFSRHLSTNNNVLSIDGEKEIKGGLYAIKVHNLTIANNVVHLNQSTLGFRTVVISFSDLFNITDNKLEDKRKNSVGILLRSAKNGTIDFNFIDNFLLWVEMTNESININCNDNHVNGIIHNACLYDEYVNLNDLITPSDQINSNSGPNLTSSLVGGLLVSGIIVVTFVYIRKKR